MGSFFSFKESWVDKGLKELEKKSKELDDLIDKSRDLALTERSEKYSREQDYLDSLVRQITSLRKMEVISREEMEVILKRIAERWASRGIFFSFPVD